MLQSLAWQLWIQGLYMHKILRPPSSHDFPPPYIPSWIIGLAYIICSTKHRSATFLLGALSQFLNIYGIQRQQPLQSWTELSTDKCASLRTSSTTNFHNTREFRRFPRSENSRSNRRKNTSANLDTTIFVVNYPVDLEFLKWFMRKLPKRSELYNVGKIETENVELKVKILDDAEYVRIDGNRTFWWDELFDLFGMDRARFGTWQRVVRHAEISETHRITRNFKVCIKNSWRSCGIRKSC